MAKPDLKWLVANTLWGRTDWVDSCAQMRTRERRELTRQAVTDLKDIQDMLVAFLYHPDWLLEAQEHYNLKLPEGAKSNEQAFDFLREFFKQKMPKELWWTVAE